MTIPVESNKSVFYDSEGDVLENGYIYVGQPNVDPRTVPKTVTFTDNAGTTFTAPQPLRTIKGKISYSGKPIVATVDGPYSLLVLDSQQKQLDYIANYQPAAVVVGSGGGGSGGTGNAATLANTTYIVKSLADLKVLDVSVGQMVENTYKTAIGDNLGAEWFVVSSTGNPGDDVDLIDFDNGLQGVRLNNKVYSKDLTIGQFTFTTPRLVVSTNDATSYRTVWTELDLSTPGIGIPDDASSVRLRVSLNVDYPSSSVSDRINAAAYLKAFNAPDGSSNITYRVGYDRNSSATNSLLGVGFSGEAEIALVPGTTPKVFIQIIINDPFVSSNTTTPELDVFAVGYTVGGNVI